MRRSISYGCYKHYQSQLARMVLGGRRFCGNRELKSDNCFVSAQRVVFGKTTFQSLLHASSWEHEFDPEAFLKKVTKISRGEIGRKFVAQEGEATPMVTDIKHGCGASKGSRHRTKQIMRSLIGECFA
jgi:hypothetical protein